jgi:hypothetical protein
MLVYQRVTIWGVSSIAGGWVSVDLDRQDLGLGCLKIGFETKSHLKKIEGVCKSGKNQEHIR